MHVKYVVVPIYEGKCPSCGEYQNSQISPAHVDDECSMCVQKRIEKELINKEVTITGIEGNFISGFYISLKQKSKKYVIEANKFYEVEEKS